MKDLIYRLSCATVEIAISLLAAIGLLAIINNVFL